MDAKIQLITDECEYTEKGKEINDELALAIKPIIEKHLRDGVSSKDLRTIASSMEYEVMFASLLMRCE